MSEPKLVRDRIPEILSGMGLAPVTRVASSDEYWLSLRQKLQEELDEFLDSESAEELADILEVIDAVCEHKGITSDALQDLKERKRGERGGFKGRIILESA